MPFLTFVLNIVLPNKLSLISFDSRHKNKDCEISFIRKLISQSLICELLYSNSADTLYRKPYTVTHSTSRAS